MVSDVAGLAEAEAIVVVAAAGMDRRRSRDLEAAAAAATAVLRTRHRPAAHRRLPPLLCRRRPRAAPGRDHDLHAIARLADRGRRPHTVRPQRGAVSVVCVFACVQQQRRGGECLVSGKKKEKTRKSRKDKQKKKINRLRNVCVCVCDGTVFSHAYLCVWLTCK